MIFFSKTPAVATSTMGLVILLLIAWLFGVRRLFEVRGYQILKRKDAERSLIKLVSGLRSKKGIAVGASIQAHLMEAGLVRTFLPTANVVRTKIGQQVKVFGIDEVLAKQRYRRCLTLTCESPRKLSRMTNPLMEGEAATGSFFLADTRPWHASYRSGGQ